MFLEQFLENFPKFLRSIRGEIFAESFAGFELDRRDDTMAAEEGRRGEGKTTRIKEGESGKLREDDFSVSEGLVLQVSRKPPQNKDFEGHSATGKWPVY